MEHAGLHPLLVCGSSSNIKITRPDDLLLAEAVLAAQRANEAP
jgi:2-C-methyl-D-erythritol 4-phosphate cytidylyltransferase